MEARNKKIKMDVQENTRVNTGVAEVQVEKIGETQKSKSGKYEWRLLHGNTVEGKDSEWLEFHIARWNFHILEGVKEGDIARIEYTPTGNEWKGKTYITLKAFGLEVLGAPVPSVGADSSIPATSEGASGDDDPPLGACLGHAIGQTVADRPHGILTGQSPRGVLRRSPTRLGVDHAVLCLVKDEFLGDTTKIVVGLHQGDGDVECLQVRGQRPRVGLVEKPLFKSLGSSRGQVQLSRTSQLEDGSGPQPTVKMVVQRHFGVATDLSRSHRHLTTKRPSTLACGSWVVEKYSSRTSRKEVVTTTPLPSTRSSRAKSKNSEKLL